MTERSFSVQAIIDADDLPCFALDRELRYTAFNRAHASAMRELYGAEIALGGRLPDYQTVAADREAAVANLERALAGERVVAGTFSGEEDRRRYFDIVHAPLRDDAGAVVGIVVRAQDVNRSYRSDRRYGLFFENNLEGFAYCRMLYDDEGRPVDWVYLAVNPAFERLTGLTAVVGRRVTEVVPTIKAEAPEIFDLFSTVVQSGEPAEFDAHFEPQGAWLHVKAMRPEAEHFVAVFDDRTESRRAEEQLRESEEKFRALAEAVPQIVWMTDADGKNTYFNQQWVDYTGMTLEESSGDGWSIPLHPDDRQRAWDAWQRATHHDAAYSVECRLRRADGAYRWWLVRGAPLRDEAGTILKWFGTCTDIEEIKQTDHRLQLIMKAVESTSDAIGISDALGHHFFQNEAFSTLFDYETAEELEAAGGGQAVVSDPEVATELFEAIGSGRPWAGELKLVAKGGRVFPAYERADAIRDPEGRIIGLIGIVSDITERKQTEEALERSQLLLRSSLESQKNTILFSIDHDYRYLYFNKAHSDSMLFAYGKDVALGTCILDCITADEDRIVAKQNYDRALAGESHSNIRVYGDLERAYYESFFNPILTESGEIIGATGLARDITERKQAEHDLQQSRALLQAAMDRSQAGIAIADAPDGRLRYVNQAGLLIRGGSEAELVDQVDAARYVESWHVLHHDGTPYAPDEVPLARAVLYGETSEAEFIIRRDDEEDRIVLARAAPIRDAEGVVTAGVVVFHDITERKQAEDEVRRLNAELEQRVVTRTAQLEATNRELEAFAYSVSHDLRAPLRAIDGFSAMVVEDAAEYLTAADVEHLQRVRNAAQRMGLLIDDLLGLSRTARRDLIVASVDLSGLAEEVVAELRREQPEREVDAVIAPNLRADADPTLLRIILVNLLGNAWKFTSKHETARIEVGVSEADGERIFFVRDDGAGFDTRHAQNLFGAFQRMHSPGEFEGTGIGLATVQRLVTRHGGRVWAEAEVEKGATFYFTLPGNGAPSA